MPVSPIEVEGVEYLVAPYGPVAWVLNLRALPVATLQRGGDVRTVTVTEIDGMEAAPVVAAYHAREGFARRYMDVPDDPVPADFARHRPVVSPYSVSTRRRRPLTALRHRAPE